MDEKKIKMAVYWAGCCGGCDVALLDLDERILEMSDMADIVFWPIALDFKLKDVEEMPDESIDICIYNGSIRNSENVEIAKILRKKSKIVVAYGSCATHGGIMGLANISTRDEIFRTVYRETFSTENPEGIMPQVEVNVPEGKLTLPEIFDTVMALDDVIDVDYYVPGCPPQREMNDVLLDAVKDYVIEGKPLPPRGTTIAHEKTVCEECPREHKGKKIEKIWRVHEKVPDSEECLLDQGFICLGPATRAGCEARCIKANMPCRGCGGPTRAVIDQGGSMLSAIASILGISDKESEMSEDDIYHLVSQIADPLGTFYRFTLPRSLLKRVVRRKEV